MLEKVNIKSRWKLERLRATGVMECSLFPPGFQFRLMASPNTELGLQSKERGSGIVNAAHGNPDQVHKTWNVYKS